MIDGVQTKPYSESLNSIGIICGVIVIGLLIFGVVLGPMAMAFAAMDNGRRRSYGLMPRYGTMTFGVIVTALSVILMSIGLTLL